MEGSERLHKTEGSRGSAPSRTPSKEPSTSPRRSARSLKMRDALFLLIAAATLASLSSQQSIQDPPMDPTRRQPEPRAATARSDHLTAGENESADGGSEASAAEPSPDPSPPVNGNRLGAKLHIVRLIAPEATQNGTQNVTIDCMFKFDRKLDQRLTIKWFFNDELEPIYQWIPELNKRVYSDRYERFLDKSYEVSEDVDYMLQAYKWLLAEGSPSHHSGAVPSDSAGDPLDDSGEERARLDSSRRLLASRLNRLAKLGGRHSSQLLESLRSTLAMDQPDFSRFRALRLLRPTTELSGRFTCSVSSLDGDDLRSTNLLVYEPARNFTFGVSRVSSQHYNLTCQATQLFPRPALALFRYRAGPPEASQASQPPQHSNLRRLAATTLRQEPLAGSHTQLTVSAGSRHSGEPAETNDIAPLDNALIPADASRPALGAPDDPQPPVYQVSSWALVDEASLSSNVVTQFECQLTIEGTGYEQRQSLALQRGWHVNSASVAMRSTLVGLFSALASLLCLMLALVSSMLIFRLLRRHANNRRVHQAKLDANGRSEPTDSTGNLSAALPSGHANLKSLPMERPTATLTDRLAQQSPDPARDEQQVSRGSITSDSDGVYRVPKQASFGTRFVIGPGARNQFYGNLTSQQASSFATTQAQQSPAQQHSASSNSFGSGKALYC